MIQILRYLFYYLSFFILFFMLGFYLYYRYQYPSPYFNSELLEHYPEDIILKTGAKLELPHKKDHFLNFNPKKEIGAIRIGAFGDSFVFGADVSDEVSYPIYLQEKLTKYFPNKKIEVLNFGVSGSGFQEQFFLWEKYAKKYELDYILVGPRWFHPDRSAVFRKNWSFELKEPLHYPKERFILENKQLKLVHINGKTLKERYKNYYKLIPSWTAFRYDIRPFFILEKFFNLNQIRNTFYYLSNQKPLLEISDFPINKEYFSIYELYTQSINSIVEKEIAQINILLLERIMKLHPKKLLILIDNLVVSEYRNTSYYSHLKDIYNITWINYPFKRHSLYRSYGHYSSLGYELSADLFFNALIGKKHFIWKRIKCDFKKKAYKVKNRDIDLTQVSAISLSSPLTPLFHFKGKVRKKNYQFSNKNTKSFLSFSSKKSNKFGNTAYYPLPIKLKNNMEIYMKFSGGSKTSLGTIQAFDPYEKFFEFSTNYLSYYSSDVNQETYFIIENLPALLKEKIKKSFGPIKLFVENYYLGELHFYHPEIYQNKKLIFKSQSENNLLLHGHDQLIREAELADKFPLYIKYAMNNGKIFKGLIPNWSCSKEPRKIPLNTINFEPLEKM